jgi:hypothetical protein
MRLHVREISILMEEKKEGFHHAREHNVGHVVQIASCENLERNVALRRLKLGVTVGGLSNCHEELRF